MHTIESSSQNSMRDNDLSSFIVPRDVIVWEGLLGVIPDERTALREAKLRRRHKWGKALACYETNEMMARKIWDLVWRFSMEIDLLTYVSREFSLELQTRVDNENLPLRRVWFEPANLLARRLAVAPDIRTIYDPDPAHQFTYVGKGRVLMPGDYNMLGAL